jgi:putative endonuclease
MKDHTYYVYLVTNPSRTTLYLGVTNNLAARLYEHYSNRGNEYTWAGKHYCYNLVYYEVFQYIDKAIDREKQIKRWSRKKKNDLINRVNPSWKFLNDEFPFDPEQSERKDL